MASVVQRLKERADALKKETAALYIAFGRKETPLLAKAAIGAAVCYALSPIDLIPDFIPVLGFLDDVLLLPCLIAVAVRLIPHEVLAECRLEAASLRQEGKPKSAKYAIPVIIIWAAVALILVKAIWF